MGETGKRPSNGENPLDPSGFSFHVFANKVGSSLKGTLNLATTVIRENKFEVIAFSLMYAFTRGLLYRLMFDTTMGDRLYYFSRYLSGFSLVVIPTVVTIGIMTWYFGYRLSHAILTITAISMLSFLPFSHALVLGMLAPVLLRRRDTVLELDRKNIIIFTLVLAAASFTIEISISYLARTIFESNSRNPSLLVSMLTGLAFTPACASSTVLAAIIRSRRNETIAKKRKIVVVTTLLFSGLAFILQGLFVTDVCKSFVRAFRVYSCYDIAQNCHISDSELEVYCTLELEEGAPRRGLRRARFSDCEYWRRVCEQRKLLLTAQKLSQLTNRAKSGDYAMCYEHGVHVMLCLAMLYPAVHGRTTPEIREIVNGYLKEKMNIYYFKMYVLGEVEPGTYEAAWVKETYWGPLPTQSRFLLKLKQGNVFTSYGIINMFVEKKGSELVTLRNGGMKYFDLYQESEIGSLVMDVYKAEAGYATSDKAAYLAALTCLTSYMSNGDKDIVNDRDASSVIKSYFGTDVHGIIDLMRSAAGSESGTEYLVEKIGELKENIKTELVRWNIISGWLQIGSGFISTGFPKPLYLADIKPILDKGRLTRSSAELLAQATGEKYRRFRRKRLSDLPADLVDKYRSGISLKYRGRDYSLHEIDARLEELGKNLARLVLNIARQDMSLVSFSLPK